MGSPSEEDGPRIWTRGRKTLVGMGDGRCFLPRVLGSLLREDNSEDDRCRPERGLLVLQWKMQVSFFYLLTCLTLLRSRKMLSVLAETHASQEASSVPEGSVEEAQFQLVQAAGHPRAVGQTPCVLWQGARSDLEPSYRPVSETVSCSRPPRSRVLEEACALSLPAGFAPGPDADSPPWLSLRIPQIHFQPALGALS